jgi:pimeloyl-ACP methyl ester carboxylesterase
MIPDFARMLAKANVSTEVGRVAPTYYKSLIRNGYARVNGLDMYYEIHGTDVDWPLITIHPWLGLANVFPSLIRNRQLIAVELQGHGRTADIDRPVTFEDHAEDVAALLEYLDLPQADVFGEGFGGIVAVQLAIRHPEMVRRVAVYGSILGRIDEVLPPTSVANFVSLTPNHTSIQFERENYERVAPDPTQWPKLFARTSMAARTWKGFSREELRKIKTPVLIVAGDHDVLGAPMEHQFEMSRLIPNAQLAVIPDAGHFVLYDDAERVLPIVATFLDNTSTVPFATTISGYHPGETR